MTWEEQQALIVKVENRYVGKIEKRITELFKIAFDAYKSNSLDELHNKFFDAELLSLIRQMYAQAGVSMARYVYKTMPKKRELKANGQMGISAEWLSAVRSYLDRHALQFVTDIIGTLRDDLVKLFQDATANGWGYDRIAQELFTKGLALRRARVIARTEAHRGAMAGSISGANSLPYEVDKEWLSATDNRVRREPRDRYDHRQLNGQRKPLDQPFKNEEDIMFPGDPNASKGNTIQCRCVLNYIPKRDERGVLILK